MKCYKNSYWITLKNTSCLVELFPPHHPINDWGRWVSCPTQESRLYILPGQHNRANLVGGGVSEPPLSCKHGRAASTTHLSRGGAGGGEMPCTTPYNLQQSGELTFPLTRCRTQESGPCPSPKQHSTASRWSEVRMTQPWCCEQERVVPITHLTFGSKSRRDPHPPIDAWDIWRNWSWGHKSGRVVPANCSIWWLLYLA